MAKKKEESLRICPINVSDFFGSSSVQEMSPGARGTYVLLLLHQWNAEGKGLPGDQEKLRNLVGLNKRQWKQIWQELSREFVEINDRLFNERQSEEWEEAKQRKQIARENGSKGGRPKKIFSNNIGSINNLGMNLDQPQKNPGEILKETQSNPEIVPQMKPNQKPKANPKKTSPSPSPTPTPTHKKEKESMSSKPKLLKRSRSFNEENFSFPGSKDLINHKSSEGAKHKAREDSVNEILKAWRQGENPNEGTITKTKNFIIVALEHFSAKEIRGAISNYFSESNKETRVHAKTFFKRESPQSAYFFEDFLEVNYEPLPKAVECGLSEETLRKLSGE